MRSPRVSYALAMATHSPWDPSPRSRFRPSRAVSGQTPVGRKEGCDGGPRPACHSTEALHSCGRLDVLQEHACPSSSLPRPQAVSTVSSNLLPGLLSKPQVPPPSVPHRPARVSRLGTQGCGSDPLCSCRSVLPAADGSLPSSRSPWSSRDPADLCAGEGPFQDAGMSPLLQSPQEHRAHLTFSPFFSFFPSSFLVTQGSSLSFRFPRSSDNSNKYSICICILDSFGRKVTLCPLTSTPSWLPLSHFYRYFNTDFALIPKDLRIYSGLLGSYLMERVFDSVQPHQDPNVCHGYLPKELGISQLTSCKVFIFSIHLSEAWCWYVGPKGCCQGSSSYEKQNCVPGIIYRKFRAISKGFKNSVVVNATP